MNIKNQYKRRCYEMENKVTRVIRKCINLFNENPIKSIHDQGAGGISNVIKEIIEP